MNWKKILLFLLPLAPWACKNDIDINAPYKDIAVVYGFLDQNEAVNYIRIQKLYQNSGTLNTSEGAQYSDSLYFDSLYVTLTNTSTNQVYVCKGVDTVAKDSGFFTRKGHVLYAVNLPKNNNTDDNYRLDILYPAKGAYFGSNTRLVKDAIIPLRKLVIRTDINNHVFPFKFTTGKNSYLYDLVVKFTYKDMNKADTNQYEMKTIDYYVSKSIYYYAERETTLQISSEGYINYLKSQIPLDGGKVRRVMDMTYVAYGGSAQFKELLDLSKPNTSIVQKNPEYSNITNGLGIFTSRNYTDQSMWIDLLTHQTFVNELPNFIY